MSANLARWLSEHQTMLIGQWETTLAQTPRHNGQAPPIVADGQPPVQDMLVLLALDRFYDALVLAAHGNWEAFDAYLRTIPYVDDERRTVNVPRLLSLSFQLRRLVREALHTNGADAETVVGVMDDLEGVLEQATDMLTHNWAAEVNRAMQQQVDEANFVAESMAGAMEQADRTTMHISWLNDLSQRLSSSLEGAQSHQLIDYVGSQLLERLHLQHVSIWLPQEPRAETDGSHLIEAVQTWGSESRPVAGTTLLVPPAPTTNGEVITDLVLRSYVQAETVFVPEPVPNPTTQGVWYQADCAVFALPLLVKEHATGVIVLQDPNPTEHFVPDQQSVLRSVASQAAIALENVRLYDEVRHFNQDLEELVLKRTRELEAERDRLSTLHAIASEVSSTLDLEALLEASLEALARITKVQHGSIMLYDQEVGQLVNRAVLGNQQVDTFTRFALGMGIAGWVAEHKQPALVHDVLNDNRWVELPDDGSERKEGGSLVAVPLTAHNETLGALILSHEEVGYFNEDHLRLLTASTGAIAVGIHNANLYMTIVGTMEQRSDLLYRQQTETSQMNAILQSLADGVLVSDPDGHVISVNAAAGEILQRNVEDLLLDDLHRILQQILGMRTDALPLQELMLRPIGSDKTLRSFDTTLQIGQRVVNLLLGPVMKENDELVGALLMLRDKTAEVESDRLKTEFIGTMSHELRTPMTSIKGFTQLLVMGSLGPVNDTQREFLGTIQTNAERMISIINDVLELTKIETGSIDLEIRPLHLAEALSGVVSELRQLAATRGHTVHISIPPGLPLVRADANRLHQILFNLLSNALKYTPSGGEVFVEAHEALTDDIPDYVHDTMVRDRRYTQIDVRDTGVGIEAHELNLVFERFYRTENPLKVEAGGTGLGLSLTKPLITMMGGHVWVDSIIGEGTTFSFVLPAVDNLH